MALDCEGKLYATWNDLDDVFTEGKIMWDYKGHKLELFSRKKQRNFPLLREVFNKYSWDSDEYSIIKVESIILFDLVVL